MKPGLKVIPPERVNEIDSLSNDLRDRQAAHTKRMVDSYPSIPVLEILKNAHDDPKFNNQNLDQMADSLTKKYGRNPVVPVDNDYIKTADKYNKATNQFGSNFDLRGEKEGDKLSMFGWRALLQKQLHRKGQHAYKILEDGMAEGGLVKGKGTGKSDSISAKLNEGDFIVPEENKEKALKIGREHLGWDKSQETELNSGAVDKYLSNGEVKFTKDEVDILKSKDIDISSLAPDWKKGIKMKGGGYVYNEDTSQWEDDEEGVPGEFINKENTDAEAMPESFVGQEQKIPEKTRTQQLMEKFTSMRVPTPAVDQESLDRLKRVGRINQIGQTANLLGDIFSLAKGAKVRDRRPDSVSPAIFEAYQRTLDKGRQEGREADRMNFQLDRENKKIELQGEYEKEKQAYNNALLKAKTEKDIRDAEQEWKDKQAEMGFKDKDFKEKVRHNQAMERKSSKGGKDKSIKIQTSKAVYDLTPEELSYSADQVMRNPQELQSRYPSWFTVNQETDMGGNPIGEPTLKLDPRVSKEDLARAYKEKEELLPYQQRGAGIQNEVSRQQENYVNESVKPNKNNLRADGTEKGEGYFGKLKRPDGDVSTELSIGVNINGKETEIPTLVPTLDEKEKQYLINTPTDKIFTSNPSIFKSIQQKAVDHAQKRIKEGRSPFADNNESIKPKIDYSKLNF
jgi:hypothetical protein